MIERIVLLFFPILYKVGTVDDVFERLSVKGIEIRTLMGGVVCQQNAFQGKVVFDNCDNASYLSRHTFFVGCHHTLSESDIKYIGEQITML